MQWMNVLFETETLGLYTCVGSFVCSFISGVYIFHHCLFGLDLAWLVKRCYWNTCCALLVTSPLVIGEGSGNWHVSDSTAGLQVELSYWHCVDDCTPGHWGESGPGSGCWWFILIVAWRICLDVCRCIWCLWLIITGGEGDGHKLSVLTWVYHAGGSRLPPCRLWATLASGYMMHLILWNRCYWRSLTHCQTPWMSHLVMGALNCNPFRCSRWGQCWSMSWGYFKLLGCCINTGEGLMVDRCWSKSSTVGQH